MEENKNPTPETPETEATQKVVIPPMTTSEWFGIVSVLCLIIGLFAGMVIYFRADTFLIALSVFVAFTVCALLFWGIHAHLCNQEKILAELRKITEKDKK